MRTSRLALAAVFALTTVACTAATAVRPPAEGGFSGYDVTADRQYSQAPSPAYRQGMDKKPMEKKAAKHEGKRDDGVREHEVYRRERTVYAPYDSEAAYRRRTLQGASYHGDDNVAHPYDEDGGDPFHESGGGY